MYYFTSIGGMLRTDSAIFSEARNTYAFFILSISPLTKLMLLKSKNVSIADRHIYSTGSSLHEGKTDLSFVKQITNKKQHA